MVMVVMDHLVSSSHNVVMVINHLVLITGVVDSICLRMQDQSMLLCNWVVLRAIVTVEILSPQHQEAVYTHLGPAATMQGAVAQATLLLWLCHLVMTTLGQGVRLQLHRPRLRVLIVFQDVVRKLSLPKPVDHLFNSL